MKVKNNGEELERGFKIDFGHHKKFSSLKCVVKIKVWRCGLFDKTVNIWETNLASLKKGGSIKKNFKFDEHKFYTTIFMDMPTDEENKNLEEIKIIDVAYTAPPFKSAAGGAPNTAAKTTTKSGSTKKNSIKKSGGGVAPSNKSTEIPQGIGKDEINEPDVQRNLWS